MVEFYTTAPTISRPTLTFKGVKCGVYRLAPVSVFVVPFGIAFGVAAVQAGMTPQQAIAMSALVFSGAAQFASLDFWRGDVPFASLALIALALNARLIIMGAALAPWVNKVSPGKRALSLLLLSDANFADTQPALKSGERDLGRLVGGGMIFWLTWVFGTALGAMGGAALGDLARFGVDVVMVTFFAATVVGMIAAEAKTAAALIPAGVACVVSVATLSLLPIGWNVIVAALVGGAVAAFRDG